MHNATSTSRTSPHDGTAWYTIRQRRHTSPFGIAHDFTPIHPGPHLTSAIHKSEYRHISARWGMENAIFNSGAGFDAGDHHGKAIGGGL
jgi:hypothetical protein